MVTIDDYVNILLLSMMPAAGNFRPELTLSLLPFTIGILFIASIEENGKQSPSRI